MDSHLASNTTTSQFGAKGAGLVLLVTLVAILLADYFLARLLNYLQELSNSFSLSDKTENEIQAFRSIAAGFINPVLMIGTSAALLKWHSPNQSLVSICRTIGLSGRPSVRIVGWSFALGTLYVFFFMGVRHFFPPGDFVTPHPENVINFASTGGKVLFALAACTFVPAAEEILFRGVLYYGIANSMGKIISAICVSVVFIALHPGGIESGYWVTHTALFISPFFLIALREFGSTLHGPIAAHAGINFAEIFF